jgi:hypothetical protein
VSGSPYTITAALGTLAAGNYDFDFEDGELTITKATLTVTAENKSREYGDANPTFTADYSGFKNGETLATSGVTGAPSLTTLATATSPVSGSPYTITAALGTLAAGNYDFDFEDGELTITKATLTVTAFDATMILGGSVPPLSAAITGFKNGETLATSGVAGVPNVTTTATSSSPIGSYAIVVSPGTLTANNYTFTFQNGTLRIQFAWDGFLQPINDTAHQIGVTESKFKLGQTIPVKFDIKDAFGNIVQQTPNPTFSRSVRLGSCDTITSAETLPSLVADATTQYAFNGGHYQLNWSTKGLTAGEYRIYANLADGTARYVDICLTK